MSRRLRPSRFGRTAAARGTASRRALQRGVGDDLQTEQLRGGPGAAPQSGNPDQPAQMGGGAMEKVKEKLTGGS